MTNQLPRLTSIFALLIPAFFLVAENSYAWFTIPLIVISLFALPHTKNVKLTKEDKRLFLALSMYFFCTALSVLLMGGELKNLDAPSRALLVIPTIMLLLKYPPSERFLVSGLLLGGIFTGLLGYYHYFILGVRAFDIPGFMVIQSGNFSMSLGLFSLALVFEFIKQGKDYKPIAFATFACLLGISASFLSGARGGWVLSPFIIIAILILHRKVISRRATAVILVSAILISVMGYSSVSKRVAVAYKQIDVYLTKDKSNTSVGYRFEMWKAGLHAFINNPVFGTGYADRIKSKHEAINDGFADRSILKHSRLHNNYIEEASIKGSIGLIVLLGFFGYPLYLFTLSYIKTESIYALLGIVHVASTMGYALTQNFINHQSGILYFIIFTALFYAKLPRGSEK
ncbi:O-antigen ligase family protein [Vibrio ishigakensis]|uniref:O-antigen ligase family protein n=1 Tax=Vibrio ishigakensis TaxID=1481914 RepID=UPI0021C36038|nr:O-antigen ligase family protein [Vibrio ishigakensis]